MIFDHGCDAFNSFLNSMAISKLFMMPMWLQAFAVICVVNTFYMATLEQYYTHYFYLPRINAVNEGIVFLCVLEAYTGFMGICRSHLGGEIWLKKPLGIENRWIMFVLTVVMTQSTVANHIRTIVSKGTHVKRVIEKTRFFYTMCLVFMLSIILFRNSNTRVDFYAFGFLASKVTVI